MVWFCPSLAKRVKILQSQKKQVYLPTNSSYQVLSADVANKHGFNTHGVIFDELHTPPTEELMKLTLEKKIAHGGHPVLQWMMDNMYIRTDPAGNIKADKEKSMEKIDGAVVTIMALDRAIRCRNDNGQSVYDERGLIFL